MASKLLIMYYCPQILFIFRVAPSKMQNVIYLFPERYISGALTISEMPTYLLTDAVFAIMILLIIS